MKQQLFSCLLIIYVNAKVSATNKQVNVTCNEFELFSYNFSGVAWSFRFATLNKHKMAPIMVSTQNHLDIKAWLIVLDLQQYEGIKEQHFHFVLFIRSFGNFSFSMSNRKLFKVSWS